MPRKLMRLAHGGNLSITLKQSGRRSKPMCRASRQNGTSTFRSTKARPGLTKQLQPATPSAPRDSPRRSACCPQAIPGGVPDNMLRRLRLPLMPRNASIATISGPFTKHFSACPGKGPSKVDFALWLQGPLSTQTGRNLIRPTSDTSSPAWAAVRRDTVAGLQHPAV